jgi:hypothetical protein
MNELSTQLNHFRIYFKDGTIITRDFQSGSEIRRKWKDGEHFKIKIDETRVTDNYHNPITDIVDLVELNQKMIKEAEGFFEKFNPVDEETEANKWWVLNIAKPALSLVLKHGNIENALVEDKTGGVVKQYLEDSIVDLQKQKERGERITQNVEAINNYKLYLTNINK